MSLLKPHPRYRFSRRGLSVRELCRDCRARSLARSLVSGNGLAIYRVLRVTFLDAMNFGIGSENIFLNFQQGFSEVGR